jgi:Na+-driven multidrug efflux pump
MKHPLIPLLVAVILSSALPAWSFLPRSSLLPRTVPHSFVLLKAQAVSSVPSEEIPSVRRIVQFAVPAMGIWFCSPLLSLVDTSIVGLLAGTADQAALNPAVAITDYSARCGFSFLYTAITNNIAADTDDDSRKDALRSGIRLASCVGTVFGVALMILAPTLLRQIMGRSSSAATDTVIWKAALEYTRIRSLGMPAAAVLGTMQAACLGLQDVQSPLRVVLQAAVVNLVLDAVLVGAGAGAAGAAWATVASQYFALGLFVRWLTTKSSSSVGEESASVTRGILAPTNSPKSNSILPDRATAKKFLPFWIPVTITQVGRCSTYIAMGHVVSTSLSVVAMAANQIVTSIFYTLIPVADSLSLTAQAFLPKLMQSKDKRATQTFSLNLLKVAILCGAVLGSIAASIQLALPLFTVDHFVMEQVRQITPILTLIFSLHGIFCGSEGLLLGRKDLKFLGRMYGIFFAVVPICMLQIKRAAQLGRNAGLRTVWMTFLVYQLFRISLWVGRAKWLQDHETPDKDA